MQEKPSTPLEPTAHTLPGGTPILELKRLWLSTRPQFLTASASPVVVGTAWAAGVGHGLDLRLFGLALVATLLIHAACNVLNDVADDLNGSDRANDGRIYPFSGGSRFIQNGVLALRTMAIWGIALLAFGALAGMFLVAARGPGVLAFGVAGIFLGIAYSLPPLALVSRGLGEAVIGLTFGLLPVTGAAWLQGAAIGLPLILLSLPVGAWVATILLINEVPDAASDASAGKRTVVVRGGFRATAAIYAGLQAVALVALVLLVTGASLHPVTLLIVVPMALVTRTVTRAITGYDTHRRDALVAAIRANLALQLAGSLWLAGCAFFSGSV